MTRTSASGDQPVRILSRDGRARQGKQARTRVPLAALGEYASAPDRPDPVALLESQAVARLPDLVPIRYGRMLTSPFAFYRGAALLMASDLGRGASPGLISQLCGDAHLSNFGVFGSPERRLVFDLNDFDETAPGPFEWDVKRLATSFEVAARDLDVKRRQRHDIVASVARSYRRAMREFAGQTNLTVWYARLDIEDVLQRDGSTLRPRTGRAERRDPARVRTRESMKSLEKLTTMVDGQRRIVSDPPLVVPIESLFAADERDRVYAVVRDLLVSYRTTLSPDRAHLLGQFELVQVARKVVGVGSVGTRTWILLMEGSDASDPLFLQAKEAQASVLEGFTSPGGFDNHAQRVVAGQKLMQSASDMFLGWQRVLGEGPEPHDYHLRQLKDWSAAVEVDTLDAAGLTVYARLCGWTLARAHARSGDRVAIAAYLGRGDAFDEALVQFASAYADQNERDHTALQAAVDDGRVTVVTGV